MIASHYAEPVERLLVRAETLRAGPSDQSEPVVSLEAGDRFRLLDERLGWGWGYGGPEGLVGYLPADALTQL